MENRNENKTDLSVQSEDIIFAALEYETDEERRVFVEEACFGNVVLRQEVDHLFETLSASNDFFEKNMPQITLHELAAILSTTPFSDQSPINHDD